MIHPSAASIKVLAFDVFGTVVDWRSSVIDEGEQLGKAKRLTVDWAAFADAWRAVYRPSLDRVQRGELPWTKLDVLHRMSLEEILTRFKIENLSDPEKDHFNRVWHRLKPWSDSVAGLQRLKARFVITTLSNGNISLLTNMAKHAGLPWDCILSAEKKHGLRTGYVHRPLEHGPGKSAPIPPAAKYDFVTKDFLDLADQMSA